MDFAHLARLDRPLAVVEGDAVVPIADQLEHIHTLDDLIAAGPDAWEHARSVGTKALSGALRLAPGDLAAPLRRPSKIVCIGLNYRDHCRESGLAEPERPLVFAKFLSSINGPDCPVSWDPALTSGVDWEAELAVVVGRQMRRVPVERALDGVFGYTAANDVSARDVQFSDEQWVRGKSLDTFCPVGPVVVTADAFGNPQDKHIVCRVNGKLEQDSNTSEMIFGVAEILSFLSFSFTLEPGDLVLTGTPWGCGGFREPPVFLHPGDVVEVDIEGVGVLRSSVAQHSAHQPVRLSNLSPGTA